MSPAALVVTVVVNGCASGARIVDEVAVTSVPLRRWNSTVTRVGAVPAVTRLPEAVVVMAPVSASQVMKAFNGVMAAMAAVGVISRPVTATTTRPARVRNRDMNSPVGQMADAG